MKVAIVGGGVCGLYLASRLGEKHKVLLFEKKETIGGKACSSLVSERIFHFLPEAKKIIRHKIEGINIHFPFQSLYVDFKKNFFVFERDALENLLFLKAKKRAQIFLGREINEFPINFQKVIFATGANSFFKNNRVKKVYFGIQGFEEIKDHSSRAEVFPTKNGFIWKIPRGRDREWGIVEEKERAYQIFEEFLKKNKIKIKNKRSSYVFQGISFSKSNKYTTVGEAKGLVKPWSFGGIIWGLFSCDLLVKNFPNFLNYEKEIKKIFRFQILFSQFLKKLVYFIGFHLPFLFLIKKYQIDGDFFGTWIFKRIIKKEDD
ncbi:MAG: NAD(P)-binding protein [Minisyncoccales bacterium]